MLPIILSVIPFFVFIVLLFVRKTKLIWVSLISLIVASLEAVFYWKIFPGIIIASFGKGFFVALDILFIIFGAILFLSILEKTKIINNLSFYLEAISKDIRIQVILLAWFFENFLEGTAGFGTPSTVVAPLLIGLGLTPINALAIALLGNSSSVVFGAAGAPIKIGFGALAGPSLPLKASLLNLVGILIPVFMLWFVSKGKGKKYFLEALPFAIWSGMIFAVPSILSVSLGQEFPSILGSVVGLFIAILSIKAGFLVPKNLPEPKNNKSSSITLPIGKVIFPYVLLIILLVVGKFLIGSKGIIIPLSIKHTFAFFNPGFAFIISSLVVLIILKVSFRTLSSSFKSSFKKSIEPFLVIAFMSTMAQIMVNSSQNSVGLLSMIDYLAMNVKNALLPLWAPFVGAFGSFLTGSATVSNLMFGNFLFVTARELSFNTDGILALALVGGAAGNMIALADILAAETVVGLKHQERNVIKKVLIPCLTFVLLVGLAGLLVF